MLYRLTFGCGIHSLIYHLRIQHYLEFKGNLMPMNIRIRGAAFACLAMMFIALPLSAEELTLRQAVELAVANNPTIAAGQLSAQAAKQTAIGAKSLTNPEILVAPSVVGDAGSDSAVLFSQPLEINGSRKIRGNIASHQAKASGFDADITTRDIVLRVSQTYWDTARAQELVKLNQDNVQYLDTVKAAVQKQYDVGAVPGAQLLKMDVELARANQELAQAQLELSVSKSELNSLMGWCAASDFVLSEPMTFQDVTFDRSAMLNAAKTNRPEISSANSLLSAARSQIKAAHVQRIPDIALQARRETFDPDSDGGVAIAVTLPLIDWGSTKAEKRSAAASAQSQEKQLEAVCNKVSLDVEQAVARVNTASQIVRDYESGILTKSEDLATMARKGYEKGANNYLELLEAQRTLRSTRSAYYSALAEHAKAIVQLEWAAACSVPQTSNSEVKN